MARRWGNMYLHPLPLFFLYNIMSFYFDDRKEGAGQVSHECQTRLKPHGVMAHVIYMTKVVTATS